MTPLIRLLQGFNPDEITVKACDKMVNIKAVKEKHHDSEGQSSDGGFSRIETERGLDIPDNVIPKSIKAIITDDAEIKVILLFF